MKFRVGQRVMCTKMTVRPDDTTAETYNTIGYYGHITNVRRSLDSPMVIYDVSLVGRIGCEAAPWMLAEPGFSPFMFWENELEAAD